MNPSYPPERQLDPLHGTHDPTAGTPDRRPGSEASATRPTGARFSGRAPQFPACRCSRTRTRAADMNSSIKVATAVAGATYLAIRKVAVRLCCRRTPIKY